MATVIIIVVIIRIITTILRNKEVNQLIKRRFTKIRIKNGADLFADNFIDSRQLFVNLNRELPNVMLINRLDVSEAMKLIEDNMAAGILTIYRHQQFDVTEQRALFNMMIIVLTDERIIEVGNGYAELLYTDGQSSWADSLARELSAFQSFTPSNGIAKNVCITGFAGRVN